MGILISNGAIRPFTIMFKECLCAVYFGYTFAKMCIGILSKIWLCKETFCKEQMVLVACSFWGYFPLAAVDCFSSWLTLGLLRASPLRQKYCMSTTDIQENHASTAPPQPPPKHNKSEFWSFSTKVEMLKHVFLASVWSEVKNIIYNNCRCYQLVL